MAGFMSGFGSAFAQSFQQQQAASAQHNEDAFRLQYQDYITQRDERAKIDAENRKNLKLARSLVANVPNTPPEAVSYVYQQLSGGMSPEYMAKWLNENQATIVPASNTTKPGEGATASDSQPADPRDNLSTAAQGSVDSQMKASGMKAPASGGIFGNIKQGLHDVFGGGQQGAGGPAPQTISRQGSKRMDEIAELSGTDSQHVQDTLQGKNMPTAGDPIDGMPNAEIKWAPRGKTFEQLRDAANNFNDATALKVWTDQNGTPEQKLFADRLYEQFKTQKREEIAQNAYQLDPSKAPQRGLVRNQNGLGYSNKFVRADYSDGDPLHPKWIDDETGQEVDPKMVAPIGQNQEKDMQDVAKVGSEAMKPYQEQKRATKDFIRTAAEYSKQIQVTGGKGIDLTGDASQFVSRWGRFAANVADIVLPKGEIDPNSAISSLDGEEKKLRKEFSQNKIVGAVDENAYHAALADIQASKLAYMMAAQSGAGTGRGVSNQDYKTFLATVTGNGNPKAAIDALNTSIQEQKAKISDMEKGLGDIKSGKGTASYYGGKYPGAPTGFDPGDTFDAESAQDPEITQALKDISFTAADENDPGKQINTDVPMPDWAKAATRPIKDTQGKVMDKYDWMAVQKYPILLEAIRKANGL